MVYRALWLARTRLVAWKPPIEISSIAHKELTASPHSCVQALLKQQVEHWNLVRAITSATAIVNCVYAGEQLVHSCSNQQGRSKRSGWVRFWPHQFLRSTVQYFAVKTTNSVAWHPSCAASQVVTVLQASPSVAKSEMQSALCWQPNHTYLQATPLGYTH